MRPDRKAGARAGLLGRVAAGLVRASLRRPALTLLLAALLGLAATGVVVSRFTLDTDTGSLFRRDLAWRETERALNRAFPQFHEVVAVVVDGVTPDTAERAAGRLAEALSALPDRFDSVTRPDADPFFRRSALLFLPEAEVQEATERIIAAQPLLGTLAADPSLRGVAEALALATEGVARGEADAAILGPALGAFAEAAEAAAEGRVAPLDWTALFTGQAPEALALRRFVLVQPRLDFGAMAPASAATAAIRETASGLGLTPENGVRVRLTGELVMGDEEFSTVFGGAITESILALAAVALLLWMGLRSARLILPMLGTLVLGLVVTLAFGVLFVGPYNPLSIAFAVLFIGLGVDFGIQYAVRLREQRHRMRDQPLDEALVSAAHVAGPGIALAALALCTGFLAFLPTDYRGLSELGLIAAAGMIIAVIASLTALPAMLAFTRPREEEQPVGYAALAPLDRFLTRRARGVLAVVLLVALAAAAMLPFYRFDANPLNLRDPTTEAVSTFRDLLGHAETTPNTVQILAPDLDAARALAARIEALPEVSDARTLADFVPADQAPKLALIRDAAELLGPTLEPPLTAPPPTTAEAAAALRDAALDLARTVPQAGPDLAGPMRRLAVALQAVTGDLPAALGRLEAALLPGLATTLEGVGLALQAAPVTLADLPESLRRDWLTPDGRARIQARPADLSDRTEAMARFARAVQAVAPAASGPAISVQEASRTIRDSFIRAGVIATVLIVVLLVAALRSVRLALLALAPLALAGLLTIATCVAIGLPLDLANIVALPLLFAQGVAFDIYYVMAWKAGERSLLPSALTRSVLYSALTNAAAFGTLAMSAHPGTAGMGTMLTMSLLYAMAAVLLTLPPLLHLFAGGRRTTG